MAAMKMANRVGTRMLPCLTPVSTVKSSDSEPLLLSTVTDMLSCRSFSILMYLSQQPYFDSGIVILMASWTSVMDSGGCRSLTRLRMFAFDFEVSHSFWPCRLYRFVRHKGFPFLGHEPFLSLCLSHQTSGGVFWTSIQGWFCRYRGWWI